MVYLSFELTLFSGGLNSALMQKQAVNEVLKYNDVSAKFGLTLTKNQAVALVESRSIALRETGRIEFGGGVIDKIIFEFCDSHYITMHNYEETLHGLIEIFYQYKNDMLDLMSDDELIQYMKKSFDGICQGSLDLLSSRELDSLARKLRAGYNAKYDEEEVVAPLDVSELEEEQDG